MVRSSVLTRSLIALAVLMIGLAAARAADPAFLSEFEDLPLMPGLVEDADRGMVFDSPSGRIVEAVASGRVTSNAVVDFYGATLPELGWEAAGSGRFRREGEVLSIEIVPTGPGVSVKFAVTPSEGATPTR